MVRYINTSLIKGGINPVDNNPEVYAKYKEEMDKEEMCFDGAKSL